MPIKTLSIIATALFAASFGLSATAEAGCNKHRGFSKSYSHAASYKAKRRAKARARARARLIAKKKAKAKAAKIAKAKARAEAKRLAAAKTESNFVATQSTAALLTDGEVREGKKKDETLQKIAANDTETTDATVVASTDATGCKRFVPAVGRTITVDCE